MTDMEIAHGAKMKPITEIAEKLGIAGDDIIQYGKYKAKIPLKAEQRAVATRRCCRWRI